MYSTRRFAHHAQRTCCQCHLQSSQHQRYLGGKQHTKIVRGNPRRVQGEIYNEYGIRITKGNSINFSWILDRFCLHLKWHQRPVRLLDFTNPSLELILSNSEGARGSSIKLNLLKDLAKVWTLWWWWFKNFWSYNVKKYYSNSSFSGSASGRGEHSLSFTHFMSWLCQRVQRLWRIDRRPGQSLANSHQSCLRSLQTCNHFVLHLPQIERIGGENFFFYFLQFSVPCTLFEAWWSLHSLWILKQMHLRISERPLASFNFWDDG